MAKIRTVIVASDCSSVSDAAFARRGAGQGQSRKAPGDARGDALHSRPWAARASRRRPGSDRGGPARGGEEAGRGAGGEGQAERASAPRAWSWPEARTRPSSERPGRSARTCRCSARTVAPGCRASSWAAWPRAPSRPRPARCSRSGDGSSDDPVRPADLGERGHGALEVRRRVGRADLHADARLVPGHHRVARSPPRRFPRRRGRAAIRWASRASPSMIGTIGCSPGPEREARLGHRAAEPRVFAASRSRSSVDSRRAARAPASAAATRAGGRVFENRYGPRALAQERDDLGAGPR